jgi:hypothetical protein
VSKFPDDLPPKAEERLFSEVLGRALGNWQHVEGQISSIFSRILGRTNDSYKAANIALNTILSFDTKLSMTHAAVTSLLAESEGALAEWNPLKNRANRRNDRRNELAHFGVVFHPNVIRLGAVIGFSPMFGIYVSTNDGRTDHRPVEPSVKFML